MASSVVKSSTYRDIDLSFTPHPISGDIVKVFDDSAIKRSIINIVFTNFGEKPYLYFFGSNIRGMLFNLFTPGLQNVIESEIRKSLETYEPRISVSSVVVDEDPDNKTLSASITFKIVGQSKEFNQILSFPRAN